jgi:polyphosphate kinase
MSATEAELDKIMSDARRGIGIGAISSPEELASTDGEHRYLNRELSWLDFNSRVLALAEDDSQPLLERAMFIAIFSSNLDEFFEVRVAGLKDQVAAGMSGTAPDGLSASEQLRVIGLVVKSHLERRTHAFGDEVIPAPGRARDQDRELG